MTGDTEREMLTKADTVALWHAVDALGYQCRAMKDMAPPIDETTQAAAWARLTAAKQALRKVNALRRAASHIGRSSRGSEGGKNV